MPADASRVKDLFVAALDFADPHARREFLDRECGGDADLRRRLDVLLQPTITPTRPWNGRSPAAPSTIAGQTMSSARWSPAGTSCWRRSARAAWARSGWPSRREPVSRKVALKLIKPGMDSRAVLARFEAERQALALMDHPNIAKVLDGGTDRARAGRSSSWSWSRACRSPSTATTAG